MKYTDSRSSTGIKPDYRQPENIVLELILHILLAILIVGFLVLLALNLGIGHSTK